MVNPYDLPPDMTRDQLEWWIQFGICVANKTVASTEKKMLAMFGSNRPARVFNQVETLIKEKRLGKFLRQHKVGQYRRIERAFREAIKLDLDHISVEMLEGVYGIGPKTARMIMLYYQPGLDVVPLDTHVLKFLRAKHYNAPKSTPPAGAEYRELEEAFRTEARIAGKTVRELDTEVWNSYSKFYNA